jgi:hypothetical protein
MKLTAKVRIFLTVLKDFLFTYKKLFWPAESKSAGIFEISLPVLELETNTFLIA